jgi:hypothetical protein
MEGENAKEMVFDAHHRAFALFKRPADASSATI